VAISTHIKLKFVIGICGFWQQKYFTQNDLCFQDCDAGILRCSAPIIFVENNDKSIRGVVHRNILSIPLFGNAVPGGCVWVYFSLYFFVLCLSFVGVVLSSFYQ
jgi:hypothetical protein